MNNKNIIIAGVIAIGVYLFSQGKAIFSAHPTQTMKRKVAPKRIGQPTTQAAYIAARIAAARKAALRKAAARQIGKKIGKTVARKVAPKRIGQPTTQAAYIAARKAAARKAAAQKIGKKIGKTVARKVAQKIKARRAAMARYAKKQRPRIQRPNMYKKQTASKLFPGAEKSRIIPYSESSKHSYYGPKSHKVLNSGYMEKRYKADQKQAQDARIEELRAMFLESNL